MTDAEEAAAAIVERLGRIKRGSLCMFGQWYGRPYDNVYAVIDARADGNCLRVTFEGDDVLEIWDPADVVVNAATFHVGRASRVRFCAVEYTPRHGDGDVAAELL